MFELAILTLAAFMIPFVLGVWAGYNLYRLHKRQDEIRKLESAFKR